MRYFDAIKGGGITLVVFLVAAFIIPDHGPSEEVQTILTVSSFLFAILSGFFLTRLNQRYDNIRSFIASEDACWLSLYKLSSFYGEQFHTKMRDLIDHYYIRMFDAADLLYYKETQSHFLAIHDHVHTATATNETRNPFQNVLDLMVLIEDKRNSISVAGREKVKRGQWLVLLLLALIILLCLFYLKNDVLFSYITTVLLSSALVLVLLIMRDLQNFRLGGEFMAVESGQEIFDILGKPRYYHQAYLADGSVSIPSHIHEYRLGSHHPGAADVQITLVKNHPKTEKQNNL